MSLTKQERQLMEKFRRKFSSPNLIVDGDVTEVDEEAYTCTVMLADGMIIYNVMLKSLKGKSGTVAFIPKVGSAAHLLNTGGCWLLLSAEVLDKVFIDAATEVVFNGGDNKGLVKLPELVSRLNNIEDALKELQQKHDTHTHTTTCTAGGTEVPPTSATTTKTVTKTKEGDIQNELIKQ